MDKKDIIVRTPRITRRLPFGFSGDWGKVYKRYTFETVSTTDTADIIPYENNRYVAIGQKVQFKIVDDTISNTSTSGNNLVLDSSVTVQTTDCYKDEYTKEYVCIAQPDDIVHLNGQYWMVSDIRTMVKYSPSKQQFFNLSLRSIAL